MKINAGEIRVGMLLEYKNDLWQVLKTQHVKPGKGGAFAQVEMKSVNKNTKLNERFRSNETIEKASLEETNFTFSYEDQEKYFFINPKTFEQTEIQKICKKFKVKFIINDDVYLAKKLNADGCHLGQSDMKIREARKLIGKKIIGITCHNSIKLAKNAIKNKADYLAFGAFNSSKTKKVKYKASISFLKKARKFTNTPIVAIGGIDFKNYKNLLLNKANFLAISGYIWKNKKLKPKNAIKELI